ncbi:RutC family protein HI_1627, partial [Durusdinium trenchii]
MSQAVRVGNIAFLAGQVPDVPDDLDADIAEQTRQVLAKIDAVVAALGQTKADIVSVQIWLADMADFQGMNAVWDAWVAPGAPPARATGGGRNDCHRRNGVTETIGGGRGLCATAAGLNQASDGSARSGMLAGSHPALAFALEPFRKRIFVRRAVNNSCPTETVRWPGQRAEFTPGCDPGPTGRTMVETVPGVLAELLGHEM